MIADAPLRDWRFGVLTSLLTTALLTLFLIPFKSGIALVNVSLVFLLLTLSVSAVWGVRAGVFAAVLTNLALNFFFIEPVHHFIVHDSSNVVALGVFLIVSVVAGSLVSATRSAAATARRRQAEGEVLLSLSRALIGQTDPRAALRALCVHVVASFRFPGAAVLSRPAEGWEVLSSAGGERALRLPDAEERSVAQRVLATARSESLGDTGLGLTRRPRIVPGRGRGSPLRSDSVTFLPLQVADRPLGVLRLDGPIGETPFRDEPERLLAAFTQEAALAVHRVELAQAAAHAEAWRQADEMKSALLASISHDLKTPLATIKTAVSSLLDATVPWSAEDRAAFLESIEDQADSLDRFISDILALNRIQSGSMSAVLRPVHVADLAGEAYEAVTPETRARLRLVNVDESVQVLADRTLIRQALVNLIENAAKYSPPGRPMTLEAIGRDGHVELAVVDEGPGISAEDLPHVFESFYRGARAGRLAAGSGLGLAIVRGFVETSGGSVRVESSPAGSRFVIDLPVVPAAVEATVS